MPSKNEQRVPQYILDHCRKLLLVNRNPKFYNFLCHIRMNDVKYARIDTSQSDRCTCDCVSLSEANKREESASELLKFVFLSETVKQYGIVPPTRTNQLCVDVYINERDLEVSKLCDMLRKYAKKICIKKYSPFDCRLNWFKKVYKHCQKTRPQLQKLIVQYAFLFPNGHMATDAYANSRQPINRAEASKIMHENAASTVGALLQSQAQLYKFFISNILHLQDLSDVLVDNQRVMRENFKVWTSPPSKNRGSVDEGDVECADQFIRIVKGPKFLLRRSCNGQVIDETAHAYDKRMLFSYILAVGYKQIMIDALTILQTGATKQREINNKKSLYSNLASVAMKDCSLVNFIARTCKDDELKKLGWQSVARDLLQHARLAH